MIHEAGKTYIGDGVYASFDGYQIWLFTDREDLRHRIALEPGTFFSLLDYAKTFWPPATALRESEGDGPGDEQ